MTNFHITGCPVRPYRGMILFLLPVFLGLPIFVFSGEGKGTTRKESHHSENLRPSVLLITLDTTRADHLGCYGASFAETPHLDSIAEEGTLFRRALSPVPLTLPSHVTLLSGLVPRRHGVRDNALFRIDGSIPLLQEKLKEKGYSTAAFVSSVVLDRITGLDRGFDHYDDRVRIGRRSDFNYEERAASQVTEAALSYMDHLGSPFFLWVHYFDPHLPYLPPGPFRDRFKDRPYDGEIAFMDHEVGKLLKAARKKTSHLIVVVAGDHGESLREHEEAAHGLFLYEATQRVPLIMEGPGIPAGKVIERNVGLVDIAPTILDLLALPVMEGMDGQSLFPLLHDHDRASPDYEMETFYPHLAYGWSPLRALVRGDLKYIEAPRPELYDLGKDPSERKNLIGHRAKEGRTLAEALKRLVGEDQISFPKANGDLLEQRRRLKSLGYVSGSKTGASMSSIDPKDGIRWIEDLESARRELQLGDPRKGIPPLKRLLRRNPENMQALLTLSQCYLASGELEQAMVLSRRLTSTHPGSDLAHFNLANALARKGYEDPAVRAEARSEYEHVLMLNPRHAEAYLAFASMLLLEKKSEEAYRLLKRAQRWGVADPDIETNLGFMEMAHGSAALAREAFERALSLNPFASRALEGLGRISYAQGQFQIAADLYARALEISPSASLAKTLGSIRLHDLHDVPGAIAAYRKALELSSPEDPDRQELQDILKALKN